MDPQGFCFVNQLLFHREAVSPDFFLRAAQIKAFLLVHVLEVGVFCDLTQPDTDFTIAFELVNIFQCFYKRFLRNLLGNLLISAQRQRK
ncbi:hypothetical protein D3C74_461020 [compost metagenome]